MIAKEFFNRVTNNNGFLENIIDIIKSKDIPYCIIGGLGVNAYAEPVVTLDCDIVVLIDKLSELINELELHYKIKKFEHSIKIYHKDSDLRIQIQTSSNIQNYLKDAEYKNVLGYNLRVASIENIFKGKINAATNPKRRRDKRSNDITSILRLIDVKPELKYMLSKELKEELKIDKKEKKHVKVGEAWQKKQEGNEKSF